MLLVVLAAFSSCRKEVNQESDIKLIGGREVPLSDWPASVYASMDGSSCTATVVGEKVLFIAAHCVSNGGTAKFKAGGVSYTARCTHGPDYRRNDTADYALCAIDNPVSGISFEVLNQVAENVKVGDELLLTGYGCIRRGGGGGNDGKYRIGEAKVQRVGVSPDNDIVTKGTAALCFGDSGGPAFKYLDAEKKFRVLVSINSRGDIATTSYLSSVATAQGKKFIKDWSDGNGLKICGVHADAVGCRPVTGVVPPSPPPCVAQ